MSLGSPFNALLPLCRVIREDGELTERRAESDGGERSGGSGMRTFSGYTDDPPFPSPNTSARGVSAEHSPDMETGDGAQGSLPVQGGPGTGGAAEQWGEFQGTCCKPALQGWGGQGSWDAFSDADPEQADPRRAETSNGQWWCEESTRLCAGPAPRPIDRAGLERLLEICFPPNPVPRIEDDIQPLEQPLAAHGQTPSPARTRTAGCLLGTPRGRRTNPDLQCKWEASALHKSYLSSLHIDPADKVHPHRAKFPSGSPAPREKQPPHKVTSAGGKEPELKLMKVASVSVHVSGFGPSHHLQSLFHHWTQPQGKTRLKLANDFNRSLLV